MEAFGGPQLVFSRQSRFVFEAFDHIEPSPQPMLIKGLVPAQGVGFLVGSHKAGKTFVAIHLAAGLAAGAEKLFGSKAKPCAAVYVGAEDPEGCRLRLKAWRQKFRRTSAPMPFSFLGKAVNLLDESDVDDFRAALIDRRAELEDEGRRMGLVVLDTLSRCIPGADENSSIEMSRAFATLDELSQELDCFILVLAHFGKSGADKGIRGWSGMDSNSVATITVERDEVDTDLRTITFAKVKNGRDGHQVCFRLENVDTGLVDDDGDPMTSCVCAFENPRDAGAKPRRRKSLSDHEEIVFTAIKYLTDNGPHQQPPRDAEGTKPWHRAVRRSDVAERAYRSGLAVDKADAKSGTSTTERSRLQRAIEGLVASKSIRVDGDLMWVL